MTKNIKDKYANGSPSPDAGLVANDATLPMQKWMKAVVSKQPIVDACQMASINALIAYVAHCRGQNQFRIERDLSDRFNVPNVKCLLASDYDHVIRYLADNILV